MTQKESRAARRRRKLNARNAAAARLRAKQAAPLNAAMEAYESSLDGLMASTGAAIAHTHIAGDGAAASGATLELQWEPTPDICPRGHGEAAYEWIRFRLPPAICDKCGAVPHFLDLDENHCPEVLE